MNIVTAVARALRSDGSVMALATGGVEKHRFLSPIDGSGKAKVCVRVAGSWYRNMSTAKYPRVQILTLVDDGRNYAHDRTHEDSDDKSLALHEAVFRVMHRPTLEEVIWGGSSGLRILGSQIEVEPNMVNRPNTKANLYLAVYDIKVG